jgi:hypothetical protein
MKWPWTKEPPPPPKLKPPRQPQTFGEYKDLVRQYLLDWHRDTQIEESGDLDWMMRPEICDQYLAGWFHDGFTPAVAADAWYAESNDPYAFDQTRDPIGFTKSS